MKKDTTTTMMDRESLKEYFKKGKLASEAGFENLIESCINKIDDGFSKTNEEGLMISAIGDSDNLLSFYESMTDDVAQWIININREGKGENKNDLQISHPESESALLTFNKNKKIGINNPEPETELDVGGWVSSVGRRGGYKKDKTSEDKKPGEANTIPADGDWHRITNKLNNCQAFEVVARTGIKGSGKHAILHAIAVKAFGGGSRSGIRTTRNRYKFWKPVKILLRWSGTTYEYYLEMKCNQNLGPDVKIKYFITHLWSDESMGIEEQMHLSNSAK